MKYFFFLAVFIGLLVIFLAFITSYLGDNIIVVDYLEYFSHFYFLFLIDSFSNIWIICSTYSWSFSSWIFSTKSE
jgi:hypothetical protein